MEPSLITIDGSRGEGGGQVLRSSLALSLVTGKPFRIERIRARRSRPGLRRQHLTAVLAAAEVGGAKVSGAAIESRELTFSPSGVAPGEYSFSLGTAGSTTLVLQTVLPALLTASDRSVIVLEGGTHNPSAPPFDFIEKTFLPVIRRMGPRVEATLERPGFYPAGGGRLRVVVEPVERLERVEILERGARKGRAARALVANLPRHIGVREVETLRKKMSWDSDQVRVEELSGSAGPGNALVAELAYGNIVEVATGFGERGVPAETVASRVVRELRRYLKSSAPVGEHLADQLLLPMAIAGGGEFRTVAFSQHASTNIEVIREFVDVDIEVTEIDKDDWRIAVDPGSARLPE